MTTSTSSSHASAYWIRPLIVASLGLGVAAGLAILLFELNGASKVKATPRTEGSESNFDVTSERRVAVSGDSTSMPVRALPRVTAAAANALGAPPPPAVASASSSAADSGSEPTQEERTTYADAVFGAESRDNVWATPSERVITAGMKSVGIEGVVACRETLCRVEYESKQDEDARRRVHEFVRSGTWKGSTMVTHQETASGGVSVRLYLTRLGTLVPEPDLVEPE